MFPCNSNAFPAHHIDWTRVRQYERDVGNARNMYGATASLYLTDIWKHTCILLNEGLELEEKDRVGENGNLFRVNEKFEFSSLFHVIEIGSLGPVTLPTRASRWMGRWKPRGPSLGMRSKALPAHSTPHRFPPNARNIPPGNIPYDIYTTYIYFWF